MKHIILFVDPEKSRLPPPRLYPWIFAGCDVGAIIIQAAGGGVARSAKRTNKDFLNTGNNMMIAEIAFQVAT